MFKKFSTFEDFKTFINGYNNHPIPLEFSQGLTTSELLHELLGYIKQVLSDYSNLESNITETLTNKFDELANKLKEDSINEDILLIIFNEVKKYIAELIADTLKYIQFELDDNGYFIALIPDCWDDVLGFTTNTDTSSKDYGKLAILY